MPDVTDVGGCAGNQWERHFPALQVPRNVHAFVQDSHDSNAIAHWSKINDMVLDAGSPVTGPDVIAARRSQRCLGQVRTHGFDGEQVAVGLLLSPLA